MIFVPKFDPDQMIALLPSATAMMGVPTFYTRLLDDPRLTRDLVAHMRLFISGSAPLLEETHTRFSDRTGHRILERYGMTETNMNTSNPYDGDRRPGTVGMPLPGVELRVMDGDTPVAARRSRPDRDPRPQRFQRLLEQPREDARGASRERLLPHRRSRTRRRGRLSPHRRTRQGPHHLRRLQHLPQGGRTRPRRPPRRARKRRHRRPPPRHGRRRRRRARPATGRRASTPKSSSPACATPSPASNSPAASSSSTPCRATPWARSRRRNSAPRSPTPSRQHRRVRSRTPPLPNTEDRACLGRVRELHLPVGQAGTIRG